MGLALALGAVLLVALAAGTGWRGVAAEVRRISAVQRVEGHAEVLRAAARETALDPNLLAAVMLAESGGEVDAVSPAGALGLLQLMLPTARERARLLRLPEPSREDLLSDAGLNVRLGAHYLKWLLGRYGGHLEQALVAYNAGPGRLDGWVREAGGWEAWRAEREAAGNSDVLRYAAKVLEWRERFAERGTIALPEEERVS